MGGTWGTLRPLGSAVIGALVGYVNANSVGAAVLSGLAGVGLMVIVIVAWSALNAPRDVDATVRADRDRIVVERDHALIRLDQRQLVGAGLAEFRLRLIEGNDLAREIRHWRLDLTLEATFRNQVTGRVKQWNVDCRTTVSTYLQHRDWKLDQHLPAPQVWDRRWGSPPSWVLSLHNEVTTKVRWMGELQLELEGQPIGPAITR